MNMPADNAIRKENHIVIMRASVSDIECADMHLHQFRHRLGAPQSRAKGLSKAAFLKK